MLLRYLDAAARSVRVFAAAALPVQPRRVGDIRFANFGNESALESFLYGLAQLHNIEYEDAAHEFREAQRLDPPFALSRAS